MKFPKFWHRASNERGTVFAKGWSESSQEEAVQNAEARLAKILERFRAGIDRVRELDRYSYFSDDVILEPVIQEVTIPESAPAIISRNTYGALVLNCEQVLFIDVDFPRKKAPGILERLFRPKQKPCDPWEAFQIWQLANAKFSLGCYRTHSGWRLVILNALFDPEASETLRILDELCNDPLYRSLCRKQKCFRARLTPKPWRMGMSAPTRRFPLQTAEAQNEFDAWAEDYQSRLPEFAVCRPMQTLGDSPVHPVVAAVLAVHDTACCRGDNLPLA
jgi:hypothetical protein